MEIFIAMLPLFAFLFIIAGCAAFVMDWRPAQWVPLFHMVLLEVLCICQLFSTVLPNRTYLLAFCGSVDVALVIFMCGQDLCRQTNAARAADARNRGDVAIPQPPALPPGADPIAPRDAAAVLEQEVVFEPADRSATIHITITKG